MRKRITRGRKNLRWGFRNRNSYEETKLGKTGFCEKDEGDVVSRKVDVDEDLRSTFLCPSVCAQVVLGRGPGSGGPDTV